MKSEKNIALISSLDVGPHQLAMLALVILDQIPALDLKVYEHNTPPAKVFDVLNNLGLWIVGAPPQARGKGKPQAIYSVSKDPNEANFMNALVFAKCCSGSKLTTTYHVAYGTLMGYPLSAIEGYVTGQTLPDKDYPAVLEDELLVSFKLSKKHWQEETDLILSWRKTLETHAPKILNRLDSCIVKQ